MTTKERNEIVAAAVETAVATIKAATPPPEKTIDTMDAGELRAAVWDHLRGSQRPPNALPLPPGTARENFSLEEQGVVNDAWVVNILAKKPAAWTEEERLAVHRAISDGLRVS
jgi:hypothetical protein